MPLEAPDRTWGTAGSYSLLEDVFGPACMKGLAGSASATGWMGTSDVAPSEPIQSPGCSNPAMWLLRVLRGALANNAPLLSRATREMSVISSPDAKGENMDPWAIKNRRRIRLIEKKHERGLTPREDAELSRLKREVYGHVQAVAPRTTEVLDGVESRLDALRRRVEARKEKKA